MHKHIGIFAYAKTKKEAREIIEQRIEDQTDGEHDNLLWDWFSSYKDNPRWDLLKEPTEASKCYELIKELQKYSMEGYDFHLKKLKQEINKKPTNNREVELWAYLLTSPKQCYLFDPDGETINNKESLKNTINKYKCLYEDKGQQNPHKADKVFLMDFDVHY